MGYKAQIMLACRKAGRRGKAFDYKDVMQKLPKSCYSPTDWQVIRTLQHAPYLEVAEKGKHRKLTKYRLKGRCIRARAEFDERGNKGAMTRSGAEREAHDPAAPPSHGEGKCRRPSSRRRSSRRSRSA